MSFTESLNLVLLLTPIFSSIFIMALTYSKSKALLFSSFSLILILYTFFIIPALIYLPKLGLDAFFEATSFGWQEAYFFIKSLKGLSLFDLKTSLFVICIYILIFYFFVYLSRKIKRKKTYTNFFYASIFLFFAPFIANTYTLLHNFSEAKSMEDRVTRNFESNLEDLTIYDKETPPIHVVTYIGESTTRLNWSLYGYPRPTTINLDQFEGKGSLIKINNVFSTSAHTSASLLEALSIPQGKINPEYPIPIYEQKRISFIEILKKSDVRTSVYSNQGRSGTWNMSSSIIFKDADSVVYSSNMNYGNLDHMAKNKQYDHIALDKFLMHLDSLPINKKSISIFHSYAGHGGYLKNIPVQYHKKIDDFYDNLTPLSIYGKASSDIKHSIIEEYDMAMRYVSDNILKTIQKIDEIEAPVVFIYFSDHGESPFTGSAHDSSRYIWEMSSIPFIMYFNKAAIDIIPDKYSKYKSTETDSYSRSLGNYPWVVFDMLGIKIKKKLNTNYYENQFLENTNQAGAHIFRRLQDDKISYVSLGNKYPSPYKEYRDSIEELYNLKFKVANENWTLCSDRSHTIADIIRSSAITNCLQADITTEDGVIEIYSEGSKSSNLTLSDIVASSEKYKTTIWLNTRNINTEKDCSILINEVKKNRHDNIEFMININYETSKLSSCLKQLNEISVLSYRVNGSNFSSCTLPLEEASEQCKSKKNELIERVDQAVFSDITYDFDIINIMSSLEEFKHFRHNINGITIDNIDHLQNENIRNLLFVGSTPNFN